MKKVLKMIGKILGIILLVILVIGIIVYAFVLQYPKLKDDPKIGKWYRVTTSEMKTSEGDKYRYVNYTETMKKVMEQAGINDADTVLVTGYSAGGFGPAG